VDRPGVSLAVDPLVLTAPAPAPGEQDETEQEAPARAWSRLLSTVDGFRGEVLVLPWADADVAALASADRVDVLTEARQRAGDVAEDLGSVRDDVVWPVGDGTDQDTVAAAAESGATAVVLPGSHLPPADVLTYTPSGRAELTTPAGPVQAALADERLSAVLRGRGQAVAAGPDEEPTELDDLTARQLLLADTAVIARERPAEARSLLLALPRETEDRPTTVRLAERLDVLQDAPWVELSPLSDLLDLDVPAVSYEALPALLPPAPEAIDAGTLRTVDSTLADVEAFASATEEPEAFLRRYTRTLGPAVATAWRQAPAARDTLVREVAEEVDDLDEQVVAEPSSTLNLINDLAHIPVRVSSSLPEPVHVDVVLDGPDQRLEATDTVRVTVPAEGQATAEVPVQAVGSGTALVEVALRTPSGEPVGTPTQITVRVRADWEDVGTAVVASVLVIMLVVGLVRTARRGRRMRGETGGTA
ncbi:DUF6049 family protein, partial [Georgenia sp. 10Sc9-8]|nr:DUF6049 family protein [Georgenia halotolerans]